MHKTCGQPSFPSRCACRVFNVYRPRCATFRATLYACCMLLAVYISAVQQQKLSIIINATHTLTK